MLSRHLVFIWNLKFLKIQNLKELAQWHSLKLKLKKIFIPKHVTVVDDGAFKYCSNLKTVEFDEDYNTTICY